jgi:hypothetical protein
VLAGLLEEFVPQQLLARVIPRGKVLMVGAIALGGVLGLIFPMCECGIIAVMRRLLRKGIPLSVCVCYMLAGPIINLVVMISTSVAFSATENNVFGSPGMAVALRCGMGYVVAFVTSLIVEWQYRVHGKSLLAASLVKDTAVGAGITTEDEDNGRKRTWWDSLANITETAMHDFIDIMAFLVIGAAIASFGRLIIPELQIDKMIGDNPVIAIAVMMALAVCFCICSEADAFVAANFQPVNFWPLSSKLAFLVLGPMLDFKLIMMYTSVFRYRLIITIIVCLVVQTFACSVVVHYMSEAWLQQYR